MQSFFDYLTILGGRNWLFPSLVSESKFISAKPAPNKVAKSGSVAVNMEFSPDSFPIQHFFNRYAISEIEGGLLIDFGLVDRSGILISSFAAIYSADSLVRSQENIAAYFGRIADTNGAFDQLKVVPWQPPGGPRTVYSIDFFALSMLEVTADIDLYHVPTRKITAVIANTQTNKQVRTTAIASLRSPVATHKLLLKDILVRIEKL